MTPPNRTLPPLRALLAFRAAATHTRLVDAAQTLGVTESAISHQIRHLETWLHTKLFERTRTGLQLTETGRLYLDRIVPALGALEAASADLLPASGRTALRLTLPPSFAVTWLIPRLTGFETAHPAIDLQLVPTTRLIDLAREQVDAAIRHGRGDWPGIDSAFLFEDRAAPVAAPGHVADHAEPTSALLRAARLIVNRSTPDEWTEWTRARGIDPPPLGQALVLDSIEQVLEAAQAGHGLAMGRSPYVEKRLDSGALVMPFGRGGPHGAAYYFCRSAGTAPTAALRALQHWFEAQSAGT